MKKRKEGKNMTEFTKILDRIDISRIAAYFLYGSEPTSAITDSYEERINASYQEVYAKLAALFPAADKTDDSLQDIVSDFALIHSDVYLQIGVLIGFQLYKVLENGYHSPKANGIEQVIKNYAASTAGTRRNQSENGSLLESFFEERRLHSLENALNKNEDYRNAVRECEAEIGRLKQCGLSKEQFDTANRAISAANAIGSEYGTAAYRQGFHDARRLTMELLQTD